jgi:hypothetical protein
MQETGGTAPDSSGLPAFKTFLSHRYASAKVNLYFFDIFRQVGQVQFEVDEGSGTISMTRLARMVRGADAFIGIYPLPVPANQRVTAEQLRSASRYFRVELELATRARKPMAVFFDERFRTYLDIPTAIYQQTYDPQELEGGGGTPSERRHQLAFESFAASVHEQMMYRARVESILVTAPTTVGLLLPPGAQHGYSGKLIRRLTEALEVRGHPVQQLPWPPVLTAGLVGTLRQFDWVVIDVADTVESVAALAFLHGHAVPMLRLRHAAAGRPLQPKVEQALFGGFEVGYSEDLLAWETDNDLLEEFVERLDDIDAPVRRISTSKEAKEYFSSADLRREQVFVSYASEDGWAADAVTAELKKRFQQVFNYKDDGESLPAGSSWMTKMFSRLDDSKIAIPLLSSSYVKKKTCIHEAEHMMLRHDEGAIKVFPLNVGSVTPPVFMKTVQYQLIEQAADAARLVGEIVRLYDENPP